MSSVRRRERGSAYVQAAYSVGLVPARNASQRPMPGGDKWRRTKVGQQAFV